MFEVVNFVVCMATYSIGTLTENCELIFLGNTNWVSEISDAQFFENFSEAESSLKQQKNYDPRSLSIIQVLVYHFNG